MSTEVQCFVRGKQVKSIAISMLHGLEMHVVTDAGFFGVSRCYVRNGKAACGDRSDGKIGDAVVTRVNFIPGMSAEVETTKGIISLHASNIDVSWEP